MDETKLMNDVMRLDAPPPRLREALEAHVERALFRRIKPWERLLLVAVAVLCIGGGAACAIHYFTADALTAVQRFYLTVTVPVAAAGALWCLTSLRRNTFDTIRDTIRVPVVVWAFLTVVLVAEIVTERPESAIVKTIAAIVVIGFPLTWDRIRAAELRIQETVLRAALYRSAATDRPPEETDQRMSVKDLDDSP